MDLPPGNHARGLRGILGHEQIPRLRRVLVVVEDQYQRLLERLVDHGEHPGNRRVWERFSRYRPRAPQRRSSVWRKPSPEGRRSRHALLDFAIEGQAVHPGHLEVQSDFVGRSSTRASAQAVIGAVDAKPRSVRISLRLRQMSRSSSTTRMRARLRSSRGISISAGSEQSNCENASFARLARGTSRP